MHRVWFRRGLTLLAFGLAIFLGYMVMDNVGKRETIQEEDSRPLPESADSSFQGFHYQQSRDGAVQWEVVAQKATVFESQQQAVLEEVEVRLLRDGGQNMTLQAEQGTIDTATNNFDLSNHVNPISIRLESGYTIYTSQLQWVDDQQEIRTMESVTIDGNGVTITGNGLVGHLVEEEFTILHNVRVEVSS